MRIFKTLPLAVLLGLLCASPALAQDASNPAVGPVLSADAMDAALAGHESTIDQQRAQLAELLSTPQVQQLASDRGIDMDRVESMAASLGDAEMEGLAPLVTKATAAMENRLGSVTISVAAIIVILLILILVS